MINVCVVTLKRYDLLRRLLLSLEASHVRPDTINIIDNGCQPDQIDRVIDGISHVVVLPIKRPLGLAQAWNRFILEIPDDRIITNDDIAFAPDSLECMVRASGAFVTPLGDKNAFSCFLLRDACVDQVGLFDETISPGYAYFEDCDYAERMKQSGIFFDEVSCGVIHDGSQTIAKFTGGEMSEHHRKFRIAADNFLAKWGFLPGGKQITV